MVDNVKIDQKMLERAVNNHWRMSVYTGTDFDAYAWTSYGSLRLTYDNNAFVERSDLV
jgi:hypothetical protein